jgi:hypothetical protein
MTLKIVGQEWADRYPRKFIEKDMRVPYPCVVCGSPDGTCTADHQETQMPPKKKVGQKTTGPATVTEQQAERTNRRAQAPAEQIPDGFAVAGGNPNMIVATKNVWVSFVPRNAQRQSTVLLFARGDVLSFAQYHKRVEMYEGYASLEFK